MAFEGRRLTVPTGLVHDEFVLRPLLTSDVERDYEAVMETRERLRRWEQSSWPAEDFDLAGNLKDLERHEREHHEGQAFTYTVVDTTDTECLGCVYLNPADNRFIDRSSVESLSGPAWDEVDATVTFWARSSRAELEAPLLAALRRWLIDDWDLGAHVFVVSELFHEQVALAEATDLELRFRYREHGKANRFRCYADPSS